MYNNINVIIKCRLMLDKMLHIFCKMCVYVCVSFLTNNIDTKTIRKMYGTSALIYVLNIKKSTNKLIVINRSVINDDFLKIRRYDNKTRENTDYELLKKKSFLLRYYNRV